MMFRYLVAISLFLNFSYGQGYAQYAEKNFPLSVQHFPTSALRCNATGGRDCTAGEKDMDVSFRILGADAPVYTPNPACIVPVDNTKQNLLHIIEAWAYLYSGDWSGTIDEFLKTSAGKTLLNQYVGGDIAKMFDPMGGGASCRQVCVAIPADATISEIRVLARNKEPQGPFGSCAVGTDCAIGWSRWTDLRQIADTSTARTVVCGTFHNWVYDHGDEELQDRFGMIKIYYKNNANPGDIPCASTSTVRSLESTQPIQVTFRNDTLDLVGLYWLDYTGSKMFYGYIPPNSHVDQKTFVSHPWIIADHAGACIKAIMPGSDATQVVDIVAPGASAVMPCSTEGAAKSINGIQATTINLHNNRVNPVVLYWINYDGKRVFYSEIRSGQTIYQQTYVSHPWVVTDATGKCLEVIEPASPLLSGIPPATNIN